MRCHDSGASERKLATRIFAHETECALYSTTAPWLRKAGVRMPRVHAVECRAGSHYAVFMHYVPGYAVSIRRAFVCVVR